MPGREHVLLSPQTGLQSASLPVLRFMRVVLCAVEALPRVRVRRPPRPVAPSPGEDPRAVACCFLICCTSASTTL